MVTSSMLHCLSDLCHCIHCPSPIVCMHLSTKSYQNKNQLLLNPYLVILGVCIGAQGSISWAMTLEWIEILYICNFTLNRLHIISSIILPDSGLSQFLQIETLFCKKCNNCKIHFCRRSRAGYINIAYKQSLIVKFFVWWHLIIS